MKKRDFFRKTQRKRLATGKYRNPYFRRKESSTSWRPVLGVAGGALIVLALFIGLLKLVNPVVDTVMIHGLVTISEDELRTAVDAHLASPRMLIFQEGNRLFFDADRLKDALTSQYIFDEIYISSAGNDITISVTEKTSQLIWSSGEELFLVDNQGTAIRTLSEEERAQLSGEASNETEEETDGSTAITELPLFVDINNTDIPIGASVLSREEMENIFRFHEHLLAQGIGHLETRIDRLAGKWIAVRTPAGYDILIDASGDIDQQASNLETIRRETIPTDATLEYIDLRFGDHVYYR